VVVLLLLLVLLAVVALLLVHLPVPVLLVLLAPACMALALHNLRSPRSQLCCVCQPLLVPAVLLLLLLALPKRTRAPACAALAAR
jgi:hypothetical protein